MIKVYCYSRCSTCKKALAWLDKNGIEHEVIDIKTDNPDESTLRGYYKMSGLPLKRFFNTSGMQYRELELSKKLPDMSEEDQLALLATDGMLVAMIIDRLSDLMVGLGIYSENSKTASAEDLFLGKMLNEEEPGKYEVFDTVEDFEEARKKLLR